MSPIRSRKESLPNIAGPPPGYEGIIGAHSKLQSRPALGLVPTDEAGRRRQLRRRALVGDGADGDALTKVHRCRPSAFSFQPLFTVHASLSHPQLSETDEDTLRRRVLWSFGSGVLNSPMMGLTHIPQVLKPTMYLQTGCLRELYLADNFIDDLPEDFVRLVRTLQILVLKRNRLKYLPDAFGTMTRLTKLDLSENQLHKLPATFENLTNMVELNLSNNHLVHLPTMCFPRLTVCDMSWNTLEQLPLAFYGCTSITDLNLSHNVLMSLSIFDPVKVEPDANLLLDPSEWTEIVDPWTGALSYSNVRTGKASRANPETLLKAAQQAYMDAWEYVTNTWADDSQKPASASDPKLNWEEVFDKASKATYYYNRVTGESSWERPEDMGPPTEESSDTVETSSAEDSDSDDDDGGHKGSLAKLLGNKAPGGKKDGKSKLEAGDLASLKARREAINEDKEEKAAAAAAAAAAEKQGAADLKATKLNSGSTAAPPADTGAAKAGTVKAGLHALATNAGGGGGSPGTQVSLVCVFVLAEVLRPLASHHTTCCCRTPKKKNPRHSTRWRPGRRPPQRCGRSKSASRTPPRTCGKRRKRKPRQPWTTGSETTRETERSAKRRKRRTASTTTRKWRSRLPRAARRPCGCCV